MYHPSPAPWQLTGSVALRLVRFYRSSVGKKMMMAASGAILVLFVIGHMVGNLKAFLGPDAINAYAEGLRTVGEPLAGRGQLLWLARLVLLACAVVHISAAAQLTWQARGARPVPYRRSPHLELAYASRTMRWGGVILLLYVIYHLLHFTFGSVHPSFVPGDVYHNLVTGFRSGPVVAAYLAATAALALHLYHGVWSALQTVGAAHPRYEWHRRTAALLVAGGVGLGFAAVPLAVLAGVLR